MAACLFKDSHGRVGQVEGTTGLANKGVVTVTCTKTYTILAGAGAFHYGLASGRGKVAGSAGTKAHSDRSFRFVVIDEAFGRGSDESARYGLELFQRMRLQLLIVTPLQKIHVSEPFISHVGFVANTTGDDSQLRNMTIQEYRDERDRRAG